MSTLAAELRTRHLPTLTFGAEDVTGPPSPVAAWLKRALRPQLVLRTPLGDVTHSPEGEPGATTWPVLGLGLLAVVLVVLAFATVGVVSLVRR